MRKTFADGRGRDAYDLEVVVDVLIVVARGSWRHGLEALGAWLAHVLADLVERMGAKTDTQRLCGVLSSPQVASETLPEGYRSGPTWESVNSW